MTLKNIEEYCAIRKNVQSIRLSAVILTNSCYPNLSTLKLQENGNSTSAEV